ncbi:MAG: DUF2271 domain-containing protein [Crocinitomicaceae bacterium]|nr:DUF2271 domain-containing protein [Crocinitomicaceae bacterium]
MKQLLKISKIGVFALFIIIGLSFTSSEGDVKYKCMIQMVSYKGEKAMVVVSLIKPDGTYDRTLSVLGKDKKWYDEMQKWWDFHVKAKEKIDGITGASIAGSQRRVVLIKVPASAIDKKYKIRVESGVEDQKYVSNDVEFELSKDNINKNINGKVYVSSVRLIPG